MNYRPDIDGLRAIAVLSVILFHSGIETFRGGFLGVDIFFVISGFLITNILINEKANGSFSLINFYHRRAKRILPALCITLLLSSLFAYYLMIPSQLGDYGQSLIASLTFSANIYFWLKTNYWGEAAELTPLIHLWSLGLEEQFYILLPAIILFCKNLTQIKYVMYLIGILSFFSMIFFYKNGNITEVFYLLPFRIWELIAGGTFSILIKQFQIKIHNARFKNFVCTLSLTILIIWICSFDRTTHPLILYPIPIFVTCLIITYSSGICKSILSAKPIVYIGTISYSLYLFHQPALAFIRIYKLGNPSGFDIATGLIIALLLAILTFHFVELPIKKGRINPKYIYMNLSISALLLSLFAFICIFTYGFKEHKFSKMNFSSRNSFELLESAKFGRQRLWEGVIDKSEIPFGSSPGRKILFLGDSMSEDLYISAINGQTNQSKQIEYRRLKLDDACFIYLNPIHQSSLKDPNCSRQINTLLSSDLLRLSTDIIVANLWESSNVKYSSNIEFIKEISNKQIFFYASPTFADMSSLLYYLAYSKLSPNDRQFKNFVYQNRNERRLSINNILNNKAKLINSKFINGFNFYCSNENKECNLFDTNDKPLIIDGMHLSFSGVALFAPWLVDQLIQPVPKKIVEH